MKKNDWIIYLAFAVLSAALRIWQTLSGYEESGLARHGFLPGALLPVVLLAAAVCFTLRSRALPGAREDAMLLAKDFRFTDNMPAVLCAVTGAFLAMLGGGLYALNAAGSPVSLLLALFFIAAAACMLYTVFSLYRGNEVQGLALLVPICALVVCLIFVYRSDATEPVLMRTYVEILAISALTLSSAQRAAFVFGGSAPRRHIPVSALASLLSVTAASEGGGLSRIALFAGCSAIELGFLAAADFR